MTRRHDNATWQVAHIVTRLDLGGAQLATLYEVANGEVVDGDRTLIFGGEGQLEAEARALANVSCRHLPSLRREVAPLSDLRAVVDIWRTLRELRRKEPGARLIVHTHTSKAGILGRWAALLAGADLTVHSAHGFGHSHHGSAAMRWLFKRLEQLSGHITDGFTADSAANVHQGQAEGLFGDAPARVVRCGIDVDAIAGAKGARVELRRELDIPDGHEVVLNLSCLKSQKDPIAYARLAAQVLRTRPHTIFMIAGDGELRRPLEAEVASLGLGSNFKILGWRRDVPRLLAASDLLVLTSRWEGLPQVFAQAMAAGLAVVATRVDGAPEAIDSGRNGLLYDVGDVDGMARGVVALLGDEPRRRRMGELGRARVGEFSRETMAATLDRFYEELISGSE